MLKEHIPLLHSPHLPRLPPPISDAMPILNRRLDRFISLNNLGNFSQLIQTEYTSLLRALSSTMPDTSYGVYTAASKITDFICALWTDIHPDFYFNGFHLPRGVPGSNMDLTLKADDIAISGFSAVFLPRGVLQEEVNATPDDVALQVDLQTQTALKQLGTKMELLQHLVSEPVCSLKFRADLDIRFGLLFAYPFFCIVEDATDHALRLSDVTSCAPQDPPSPESPHLASLVALWFALSIPEQDVRHTDGRITYGVKLDSRNTNTLKPPAEPSTPTTWKVLDRIHVRWTGSSSSSPPMANMRRISREQLQMLSTDDGDSDGDDTDEGVNLEEDEEYHNDNDSDDYHEEEMDDVEAPPTSEHFDDGLSNSSGRSSRSPTPASLEIAGYPAQLTITGITGSDGAQLYRAVLDMGGPNQRSILLKAITRTRAGELADELAIYERLDARTSADKSPSLVPPCLGAFADPRCAWVGAILEHSESCPPFDALSPTEKNDVYNALRRLHSLGVQRGSFHSGHVRRSVNGEWWITNLHGASCEHQCPGEECGELVKAREALGL
ncbi:hypothetical protein MIND_00677500 [Mycena indigotica]|uniref:Uncharacterized protein n=1 Tax=Mycena indigotica TaxID=2126181 RepID=A0A8H6SKL9_9AGAR|nr:uncharacterized protein MIND_00677500 [Mycena indigotica]KAF7301131.1 hypothetical protein MIND_00677500 [Mycena indigotica]